LGYKKNGGPKNMTELTAIEMTKLRERMSLIEEKIEQAGDNSAYGTANELQQIHTNLCGLYENYQKMLEK
jgi:hypothetical protein